MLSFHRAGRNLLQAGKKSLKHNELRKQFGRA
jgi:hypothetical protein